MLVPVAWGAPETSSQPRSWQEREATTTSMCYMIPYGTEAEQAVSMATTAFLSNTRAIGSNEIMV